MQFYWSACGSGPKKGYQHPQGYCKECTKKDQALRIKKNPEQHAKYVKTCVEKLTRLKIELKDKPCADCRKKYPPYVMDFDHREGEEKSFLISKYAGRVSRKRLLAEAAKCDVVCANCHRERTHQRKLRQD